MTFQKLPLHEAARNTTLRGDLSLPDAMLEARYERQWQEFLPTWWAWYEQYGASFFGPKEPA